DYDDAGAGEDDRTKAPLQTAAGSTPTGRPVVGKGQGGDVVAVRLQKAVNAASPLAPTAAEDANDSNSPRQLATGATVVWTYLVPTTGTAAFAVTSLVDDNGTPDDRRDDFSPVYVSGDNGNGLVDVGETWLYTSAGVVSHQAKAGLHGNVATVDVKA